MLKWHVKGEGLDLGGGDSPYKNFLSAPSPTVFDNPTIIEVNSIFRVHIHIYKINKIVRAL